MEYPKPVPNDPTAREAHRKNRPPPSPTIRLSERLGSRPPPYRNSVSELMSRLERVSGDIADCSHILRENHVTINHPPVRMCVDKPDESLIARVLRCINRSSDALEPTISYSIPPTESPQSEKQNMAEFRDDSGIGTYGSDQDQVQSTYHALHLKHTPKQYSPASSAPQTTQSKPEHLQRAFVTLRVALASGELTPDEVLAELSDEKITEMRHILQHLAF